MGRTSVLGMVITGNASAEINQCPPAKTSHCRRLVHQWMSDVQCWIGQRRRFNGFSLIGSNFSPGWYPNSSCWVLQAGLNALIPWPAFRVVSIDWPDIGAWTPDTHHCCPASCPIHQSSLANWDPKWGQFTPLPPPARLSFSQVMKEQQWLDHTQHLAFLMK